MSKPILGIDVSKLGLTISLLIDKNHYHTKVDNNKQGFEFLFKWLKQHKVNKVSACMEATGIYSKAIADFLYIKNHEVSIVNPSCINAFAKSKLASHKTDKVDSMLIAEYASKNDLIQYILKNKPQQGFQDMYRCLQNLKHKYNQVQNYLENKDYLPSSVYTSYNKLLLQIEEEIDNIQLSIDNILVSNIELKQKIDNMQSIPGIGKLTAVAILAESPDLDSVNSARELAAYAGLTPKHRVSGTSVRGKSAISKIGSAKLRKALYFPAIAAKNHNTMFKKFT